MVEDESRRIIAVSLAVIALLVAGVIGFLVGSAGDDSTAPASTTTSTTSTTSTSVATTQTTSTTQVPRDFPDLFEDLRGAVASVEVVGCDFSSQGTAFLVDSLTAYTAQHVIDGAAQVALTFGGESVEATVIGSDEVRDVAVLRLAEPLADAPFLRLADTQPRVGEEVAAMGHPQGLPLALTVGRVTSMNGQFDFGDDVVDNLIQTDAVVAPGSSGGPLINDEGAVIGVVILKDLAAEGLMYAGNIEAVRADVTRWQETNEAMPAAFCVGSVDLDTIEELAPTIIDATIDHPEVASLQVTFAVYTQAINSGRAEDAFRVLGPAITNNNTPEAWAVGQSTSALWDWRIRSVDELDATTLAVRSTFTSTQQARFGFDGSSTCTRWDITHELVPGLVDGREFWLINRSRSTENGGPVDCANWVPELGSEYTLIAPTPGESTAGNGQLAPGFFDRWNIALAADDTVVATLDATAGQFDPIVRVFDPDGNLVVENDDRGDGSLNSEVQFTVDAAGVYQIVVRDLGDFNGGDYRLGVALAAG